MTATADIIVVGGGVIGASTTFHLATRGARVTLLERGTIGCGETHKSGGFVQTHWDSLAEVRLIARSREVFQHWAERVGGDCGWQQQGYLHVTGAEREADVRRVHQMLLDEKLESHWLDPQELAKLLPLLHVEDLAGGAYEPASGWADPLATTRAFAEAARRAGAEIREGVAVTRVVHAGGKITGVETTAGEVSSRVVVLAVGPYIASLHAGAPLPIQLERGQVCYFERGATPELDLGFYDELTGLYAHPDGDTNLVGIDHPFAKVDDPDRYKRELDDDYIAAASRAYAHRFPRLAGARLVRGHVGLYDFTPVGQPIIDRGELDGYYLACGFSGVGFKSAPATGLGLAELVLDGRPSSVDLSHLSLARFATAPAPAPPEMSSPAATPSIPSFPPALVDKLTRVRDALAPEHQAALMPYVMSLAPVELAQLLAALMSDSVESIVMRLSAELSKPA